MCCAGSRLGALASLRVLAACSALSMALPPEFLQLETGRGELKATTPDDGLLWVREFVDRDQGDLGFWTESMRRDLVENRGYVLVDERPVQDGEGRPGTQLRFRLTTEGQPHGYLVTIFVLDGSSTNTIRVAEFVAPAAVFDARADAVRTAMLTVE